MSQNVTHFVISPLNFLRVNFGSFGAITEVTEGVTVDRNRVLGAVDAHSRTES